MSRKRRRRVRRSRGIALIMVLGALTILTMMLAEFQTDTSATLASALADRDGVQAEYDARSEINLSRLLIAMEPTIRQGIAPLFALMGQGKQPPQLPIWEFADRILAPYNDKDAANEFANSIKVSFGTGKNLGLPTGRFEVKIVDEDAKINVNLGASNDIAHIRLGKELMGLLGPAQYDPLFSQRDSTGNYNDRMTICAAIIDWADVDEQQMNCDFSNPNASTSAGMEDSYYQLLAVKPYRRKNAPYDSLEELHLVRGVSDDFWATFVDPDPTKPDKRVMTVWGQGAINVNSANAQTLLGVVCSGAPTADICINPVSASMFLSGITMARAMTMGAPLFGSTGDFIAMMKGSGPLGGILKGMGMKPVTFLSEADFAKTITTESKVFSIYAIGIIKGYKRETRLRIRTVVDFRNAPNLSSVQPPTGPGSPSQPPQGSSSSTKLVMPATAGNVIFFRID